MHKNLDALLKREMTRKEFMATLGFGAASVMGLGSLIKFIKPERITPAKMSAGYGSRPYGS